MATTSETPSSVTTDAVAGGDSNATTATTAPPSQGAYNDEDLTMWVPYLSLICLVAVLLTLTCSFLRHRKRVMKRRRNISDYLEHDIDLNRKRLFGMMRKPFDVCQESFSASSVDFPTKSRRASTSGYQNSRQYSQYSYDFHFPQEPVAPGQLRGGFQRHESTIHPMPGVDTDDSGYSNTYDYASPNPNVVPSSCGSQRLCHHHCIVSCPFCWRAVQNEMGHLFDKTQDYLYQKHENYPPNFRSRNIEEDVDSRTFGNAASKRFENSHHDRKPMRNLQSNSAPAISGDSGTVRKGHYNDKTMDSLAPQSLNGPGSSGPKITTRENDFYMINQRTGEDETAPNSQERNRQNVYSNNFHGHSDTDFSSSTAKKPINHQPLTRNSLRHIRTDPNLSSQSSSSTSEIPPTREHSYKRYKLLSKVARLNFPTAAGASPPKSPSAPPAAGPDDEARTNHHSGPSRSVAFTNTAFQDPSLPFPSHPQPESLLGTEGVINYGFQSDLSTAFSNVYSYSNINMYRKNNKADLSNNKYSNAINDHIDVSSSDAVTGDKQNINDKNYSGDSTTTIKRKKKKHFLKTHTRHSAEASSETLLKGEGEKGESSSFSSSSQRRQSLQSTLSRQPNVRPDHCLDLSVIEVANTAFDRIPSAGTISNNTKSFNTTSNDINV